jgi:hypothetical protein
VYTDVGTLPEALELDSTSSIALYVGARAGTVHCCGRSAFRQQHADQLER